MRNTSDKGHGRRGAIAAKARQSETRATFVIPTPEYEAFKAICQQRDETFSRALRRIVREQIAERAA